MVVVVSDRRLGTVGDGARRWLWRGREQSSGRSVAVGAAVNVVFVRSGDRFGVFGQAEVARRGGPVGAGPSGEGRQGVDPVERGGEVGGVLVVAGETQLETAGVGANPCGDVEQRQPEPFGADAGEGVG